MLQTQPFPLLDNPRAFTPHTSETRLYFASWTKERTSTKERESGRWEPGGEQPETSSDRKQGNLLELEQSKQDQKQELRPGVNVDHKAWDNRQPSRECVSRLALNRCVRLDWWLGREWQVNWIALIVADQIKKSVKSLLKYFYGTETLHTFYS